MKQLMLASLIALATLPAVGRAVDARCQVWQRELSFAQSVQAHDAKAFAEHIEPGAVFDANSPHPQRGRDTIVREWRDIVAGKTLQLSWYPTAVVIGGEPDLAFSSGSYLMQQSGDSKDHRDDRLGRFSTVWHRGKDGVWRVLFDSGDGGRPANEAQIKAFHAGRQPDCQAGQTGGS